MSWASETTSGPNRSTINFFGGGNLQIVPLSWRKEPRLSGNCCSRTFEIILLGESERVALLIQRWQLALDKAVGGLPLLSVAHTWGSVGPGMAMVLTNSSVISLESVPAWLHTQGPAPPLRPSQLGLDSVWSLCIKCFLQFILALCHNIPITRKWDFVCLFTAEGNFPTLHVFLIQPCSLVRYRIKNSKIRQASVTLGTHHLLSELDRVTAFKLQHLSLSSGANCTYLSGRLWRFNKEVKVYFSSSLLNI